MADYPEEIRADEGDELGSVMGWHLDGHVDLFEVELFMGDLEVAETFDGVICPAAPRGFDVDHVYVRKVPAEFGYRYQYSNRPGPGLHPVTRIQENVTWEHWCANHPEEIASSGVPPQRIADLEPLEGDRAVYLCRDCMQRFAEAEQAATEVRLADYYAARDSS